MDKPTEDPGRPEVVIDFLARRAVKTATSAETPLDADMAATIADLIEIQTVTLGLVVGALVQHGFWTEPEAVAWLDQLARRASSEASAWPFQCLAERIAADQRPSDGFGEESSEI